MEFSIATKNDFEQLASLRRDFRMETGEECAAMSKEEFITKCVVVNFPGILLGRLD